MRNLLAHESGDLHRGLFTCKTTEGSKNSLYTPHLFTHKRVKQKQLHSRSEPSGIMRTFRNLMTETKCLLNHSLVSRLLHLLHARLMPASPVRCSGSPLAPPARRSCSCSPHARCLCSCSPFVLVVAARASCSPFVLVVASCPLLLGAAHARLMPASPVRRSYPYCARRSSSPFGSCLVLAS